MRLVILLALLVIVVIVVIRLQGNAYKRFMRNAGEASGHIEKKETRIDNTKNQRADNFVLYRYEIDGISYQGEDRVEYDDLWHDASAGMEIKIYYDKNNPKKSYPAALLERRLKIASKLDL